MYHGACEESGDLFLQKYAVHSFHYNCISPSLCVPSDMLKHLSPQFST